jgi:ATPase family associated with various cellular activities (AAA)/AAA+ lid domain
VHPSTSLHDLKSLILSLHPAVAIETEEEERVERLVEAVAQELGLALFEWSLTQGLLRWPEKTPNYTLREPGAALGHLRGLTVEGVFLMKDLTRHLEDPATARAFADVARQFTDTRSTLVLAGAALRFPPELEGLVVHFDLALPGEKELWAVVESVLASLRERRPIEVRLDQGEREELLRALSGLTLNQARQAVAQAVLEDGVLQASDLHDILDAKARALASDGLVEYLPAADNVFELGGFARLKAWLERARVGFSEEARALNLPPPRGILLAGVQGCGKSLAAKCVAGGWRLPLLKLDAGRLYDKYVGQTEKNLRRAMEIAESMAPVVLWIDELEKSFASGGENDGGVSQRVLATFLTWLQEKKQEVFVVATANDVFSLPPELLRKGRFDEIFFVDLPDRDERAQILRIHLFHRKQEPERFDLDFLADATDGWSGAELEQAVTAALYDALHRKRPLDTTLLLEEIGATVPLSVSRREDVERLRALAQGRFVPVR